MLQHEVQNNLPISFINSQAPDKSHWLLGSVKDEHGGVVLVAASTPPFNLMLYETSHHPYRAGVTTALSQVNVIIAERSTPSERYVIGSP